MKVKKEELEQLTEDAVKIGMVTLATLAIAGCPYPEIYERIEQFEVRVDNLRENLGLEKLNPPEMGQGMLSKTVAEKMLAKEFGKGKDGKSPIGFQIPNDPSKMN